MPPTCSGRSPPRRMPSPGWTRAPRRPPMRCVRVWVARLAFAEAAGWLASAADRAWIHPRDLALAEAGLLGDFAAAALGGRAAASLPATAGGLAQGLGGHGRASAILAAEADRLPDGATL